MFTQLNAYVPTAVGIVVSIALFLIGYRQTIGARKQRLQIANDAILRAFLRRIVLEEYKPKIRDIVRLRDGKAQQFKVSSDDLASDEQVLAQIFAAVFDNDFIAPKQRADIERQIEVLYEELLGERDFPSAGTKSVTTPAKEYLNNHLFFMGVSTSVLGAVTALAYFVIKQSSSSGSPQLSRFTILGSVVAVFVASLASVTAISLLKRPWDRDLERKRSGAQRGILLEKRIARVLRKSKLQYAIQPEINHLRPDFLFGCGGRKIAIEGITTLGQPPLNRLKRLKDHLSPLLKSGEVDELLFVTDIPIDASADKVPQDDNVRFLSIEGLKTYIQDVNRREGNHAH